MNTLGLISSLGMTGASLLFLIWAYRLKQRMAQRAREEEALLMEQRRAFQEEERQAHARLKEDMRKRRLDAEFDVRREKMELERQAHKLSVRHEQVEERRQALETQRAELAARERLINRQREELATTQERVKDLHETLAQRLETLADLSREEARKALLETFEHELRHEQAKLLQKLEEETRLQAKQKAIHIMVDAMQRHSADHVAQHSSGVVHLPSEEMTGRIIGKEGRNIKALEMATGMEFVIGETPQQITISGFNPIRREIARRSLEKLMLDGRINPTRIEEVVHKTEAEIHEIVMERGTDAVMRFNLQGVKPEMVELLGKLHFRTSYSQNVLSHSIEVAYLARMIAEDLGLENPQIALRAGLFHDMGKALSAEQEGPHALIGAEVARRCGEDPLVVNAIAAHHEEAPFISPYDIIIIIADRISALRPGARRETLATYLKRLEQLESLAEKYPGVKKSYALQAGRELRVIVEEHLLSDEDALLLARNLARDIEVEMAFPGHIKVHVIRETRAIEYAR